MKAELTIKVTKDKQGDIIYRSLVIQFPDGKGTGKEVIQISSIECKYLLERGVEELIHQL